MYPIVNPTNPRILPFQRLKCVEGLELQNHDILIKKHGTGFTNPVLKKSYSFTWSPVSKAEQEIYFDWLNCWISYYWLDKKSLVLHLLFAPWGILLLCTRCLSITQRPSQCPSVPPPPPVAFEALGRRLQTSNCESAAITPLWSSLCLVVSVYWPDLNLDKGKNPTPGKGNSLVFSKSTTAGERAM